MRRTEPDYEEILQRVDQRLSNTKGCLTTFFILILLNIFYLYVGLYLWDLVGKGTPGATADRVQQVFMLVTNGPITLYLLYRMLRSIANYIEATYKRRAIRREMEYHLWEQEGRVPSFAKAASTNKQKNQVVLVDDGELVTLDDYLDEQQHYSSTS